MARRARRFRERLGKEEFRDDLSTTSTTAGTTLEELPQVNAFEFSEVRAFAFVEFFEIAFFKATIVF